MLVPGVLNGSKGPLYYPKEEVARNVDAWNGMPLTCDHPTDDSTGLNVSARDPGTLERHGLGHVYRVRINNQTGSLQGQAWFDEKLVKAQDEILIKNGRPTILLRLLKGEPIELSTGLFTRNVPAANGRGVSPNGREYVAIARDYKPDHLAILPDSKGACSLRDGCGVHINNTKKKPSVKLSMSSQKACRILKDGSVHGHPLTKAQRGMFGAKCGEGHTSNEGAKVGFWKRLIRNLIKNSIHTVVGPSASSMSIGGSGGNCGIGAGGFQKGNHCASGGGSLTQKGAKSGASGGVSQSLREDIANNRLRASNASTKAMFASSTALEKHPDDKAEKLASTARKLARRATAGVGYAGLTPEHHEAAAKAHAKAAQRHEELDTAMSGSGAVHHALAHQAHRDAAMAHMATAHSMRRLRMVGNARKLSRRSKTRNFDQNSEMVTNRDSATTPFLPEKGSAMTGKQKMVQYLTNNCECWQDGEDILNSMDDTRLKNLIRVARRHMEDGAIANAVRESIDDADEMDLEELTTVTANALKGEQSESTAKKKKKKSATCTSDEPDEDDMMAKNEESLEDFLQRDDIPKSVKRLVKNAQKQEKQRLDDVVKQLQKVAKVTTNKAKRTLIANKLKRHDEIGVSLESLEELLIAVQDDSKSGRQTNNARIKINPDDDDDDDDDDAEKTVTNRITNYGGGGGVTNRRKNDEEEVEYVENADDDVAAMVTPELDYSEIVKNHDEHDLKRVRK